ncbi:MAG: hypothetical protein LUQ11_10935 [Methylococcaceae bacterium]|nr:hypothetical protein [Methylococcaceae bacterium]
MASPLAIHGFSTQPRSLRNRLSTLTFGLLALSSTAVADVAGIGMPGDYGLKIYKINYGLYPYVQVYFRTFDQNQQPS